MHLHISITIFTLIIFAAPTFADVQEFENEQRPEFFDAVGGVSNVTTVDFTGFANNTELTDQYSDVGLTFDGFNLITLDVPSFEDDWGLRIFNGNDLYFDEPINWIAADLAGEMVIDLYKGEDLFYTSGLLGFAGIDNFGGLISDMPFDHVFIYDPSDFLTVLDDLHFGPPIPAPGVLAPFGLILLTHKRRARTS